MVYGKEISLATQGHSDIKNITSPVSAVVRESGVENGIMSISSIGSTASITTIEYEPALVEDFQEKLEQLVSEKQKSRHSETWGDDNGFSHMRASLMGPGITLPIANGSVVLGTWQQIVVVDHDNRPRNRRIFVQIVGE